MLDLKVRYSYFNILIILKFLFDVLLFLSLLIFFLTCSGVYLPLLWDQSFCIRSPIALGYTRGHFTALVTMEPYSRLEDRDADQEITFLPLMDHERKMLPVHFLTQAEVIN